MLLKGQKGCGEKVKVRGYGEAKCGEYHPLVFPDYLITCYKCGEKSAPKAEPGVFS